MSPSVPVGAVQGPRDAVRGPVLRGAQVLRLQAGMSAGRGVCAALPADEEQLRVHQEEDLPAHAPAGKVERCFFEVEEETEEIPLKGLAFKTL